MIIDEVYVAIRDRLMATLPGVPDSGLKTVDWNTGQFEVMEAGNAQSGLVLPAALVRYETQGWHALGKGGSHCDAVIYIDIGQSVIGEAMASDRDASRLTLARDQFELEFRCEKRLHRLMGNVFNAFKLVMMEQDHAFGKLRVTTIGYKTRLFQDLRLVHPTVVGMPTPVITTQLAFRGGDFNRDFSNDFHNTPAVQP